MKANYVMLKPENTYLNHCLNQINGDEETCLLLTAITNTSAGISTIPDMKTFKYLSPGRFLKL